MRLYTRNAPDTITAKAALNLSGRIVLSFTGLICGWNAVHQLIAIVAHYRHAFDLHVLVAGDGPARASLQDHAWQHGIADWLTITGIVGCDDMAASDIAMLPGVTPYSSRPKLFEHLQLGRAIVALDMENIRETLSNETAVLFEPHGQGALEAALLRLCQDPGLRTAFGYAVRARIAARLLT